MDKIHTCICSYQEFLIHDTEITCMKCGKTYGLMWLDDEMESSKDFNERIKKEA